MAETVRTLLVKLAYDVDTTGRDRFESSFKQMNANLSSIAKNTRKQLDPKKVVPIGPLERRVKLLGKRFRRRLRKALRISPANFVKLEKDLAFIGMKVKNALKKATKIAKTGAKTLGVALAGIAGAGTVAFKGFADIEQARLTLAFRTSKDEADSLIKRVEAVTKSTKGVVTQLDAINAISFGGNITDQTKFFADNLERIIKLSKVAGQEFKETSDSIARFIETGQGLDELVRLEIISASQKEALVKSGTAETIGKQGIQARTAQAQAFLIEGAPRVNEFFKEFEKTGNIVRDQLKTSAEEAVIAIGKRASPAVIEAFSTLRESADNLKESLNKGDTAFDAWTKSFSSDTAKSVIDFFGGETSKNTVEDVRKISAPVSRITDRPSQTNQSTKNQTNQTTEINQQNTITIQTTAQSPEEIANVVDDRLKQKIQAVTRSQARKTIPKSPAAFVQVSQ